MQLDGGCGTCKDDRVRRSCRAHGLGCRRGRCPPRSLLVPPARRLSSNTQFSHPEPHPFSLFCLQVPEGVAPAVLALQRAPQFEVWQLPPNKPLAVFACCDGFDSNLAVPSYEHLGRLLTRPVEYLRNLSLEGSVLGQLLRRRWRNPEGTEGEVLESLWEAVSDTYKNTSLLDYVLDKHWHKVRRRVLREPSAHAASTCLHGWVRI